MYKHFLLFAFILLFCQCTVTVLAEGVQIEQVRCDRPQINVYGDFDFDDISQITAAATISDEQLNFVHAGEFDANDGIMYIFLVDCSTSITYTQMNNIKSALTDFVYTGKTPNDRMCIISFGTQTDILTDGTDSDEDIINIIDTLRNNQDGTVLFDAVSKSVELADITDDSSPVRKVAVIISDADDFNVGGHTLEEITSLTETSSLPFYAVALNTGSKYGLDSIGKISRTSGGEIDVASAGEIQSAFTTIIDDIKDCDMLSFSTEHNVISGQKQLFNLNVVYNGKTYSASRIIPDLRWTEDLSAPYVVFSEQLSPNTLKLTFSEDVLAAGDTSSYAVSRRRGKVVPLLSVSYDQTTHSAILTFVQTPVSGNYSIQFSAITDNSMEKNPISNEIFTLKIKGRNVIFAFFALLFTDYWWILLILLIAAACLISYNILKKRDGLMFVNGKFSFGDKVKIKVKKEAQPAVHKAILDMTDTANITTQIDVSITTSMIFGRSDICDITLSDPKMSRQHFVLEAIDGGFCITNLSETNGTLLNGVQLVNRRKLQQGDKIMAGQSLLTVRTLEW